ncbi:Fur family transcriptional regulator [Reinekea blandensis]|uniref:Fe2+/Zn2+ uptake regulation protein n=1 Tax=Reinekea blandensis MED297 TaxID=314283 RepID=A4BI95_9GAMM|nr:Fur family transcriptional regulator [Reinekea blandensis]EAR08102.1 Fe2+/Zn2+ uptake regulation protein [Reinekea sp. MED297] [Reinekea blandensis MED297]
MNQLDDALQQADQASTRAGLKLTPKRRHLFSLLLASDTPLSAYELADRFKDSFGQAIPAMSVYRMLDFLTENNLAHKLTSENKFVSCAHSTCNHAHQVPQFLICERCHQVKEVGIKKEVFDALRESVDSAGYSLREAQLELKCLCAACAEATE